MLYLASRSPRRHELLQRLDVPFQTLELDVPEVRAPGESPEHYVHRVALDKARAGLALVQADDAQAIVLGSDTEVVLGERVFGKPVDVDDAIAMLTVLAGRTHQVLTAVVLVGAQRPALQALVVSEVTFDALDATGSPLMRRLASPWARPARTRSRGVRSASLPICLAAIPA